MPKSSNILITGVSTGIGYDLTKEFLRRGYSVFGSVRKQEDVDRLNSEMGEKFFPLLFDVTDFKAVDHAAKELEGRIGNEGLAGLVNNAGVAIGGPLVDLSLDDYRKQFEVNFFGAVKVTQAFLPLLGMKDQPSSDPGRIMQMSSVAGKFGMPFMSPYVSSKHALEGLSESLRKELLPYGIDVVVLEPGPIKTPIWHKGTGKEQNEKFQKSVYKDQLERFQNIFIRKAIEEAWTSAKVAKMMVDIFEKPQPKTRYPLVAKKLLNWTIPQILPDRVVDRYLGKALKLIK